MIGIQDSEFRQKDRLKAKADEDYANTSKWVKEQFRHACYVENDQTSVANVERQLGNPITGQDLKKIIEGFDYKFKVDWHPFKDKLLVHYLYGNDKRRVCITEGGMVPEFSIMSKKTEMRPSLERRWKRGDQMLGKEDIPWREEVRGWRTTLAILVNHGLLSAERADRAASRLSSHSRESWQALLGKSASATNPF